MDPTVLLFLSSGLFLGWSLGANDAANVFGTAVGSRMIKFGTAALICSVFLLLGSVISGAGAAHGLGKLGAVNALAGSFMVALAAALTVYMMTKASLPVSTTQAIVGGIVGWNLFSGSLTDLAQLAKIVGTWVACPVLGAIFGALLYKLAVRVVRGAKPHVLRQDSWVRMGLILAGAFGSYSLGANNIGNVMGVFVSSSPFETSTIAGLTFTSTQKLFLVGAIMIGVGVFTYSKRVMMTVGSSLFPLTPLAAFVVVISQSVVLFLFSSKGLEHFLLSRGLPAIPLIPVSSSQAVVGSVVGIALTHGAAGARQVQWSKLGGIATGWVATPTIAAVISFFSLFFLQNVFQQEVYRKTLYEMTPSALAYLEGEGVDTTSLGPLQDSTVEGGVAFRRALRAEVTLDAAAEGLVLDSSRLLPMSITRTVVAGLDPEYLGDERLAAVRTLVGRTFQHRFELEQALEAAAKAWSPLPDTALNRKENAAREERLDHVANAAHAAALRAAQSEI